MNRYADREMISILNEQILGQNETPEPDNLTVLSLLDSGDVDKANRMILSVRPYDSQDAYGFWDMFEMLYAYLLYRGELSDAAAAKIREVFRTELVPSGRVLAVHYSYANVNHPLTCYALSIIGGEIGGIQTCFLLRYDLDSWSSL
jgi:hypothetical protein